MSSENLVNSSADDQLLFMFWRGEERFTVRLDEKLFIKKLVGERLEDDCISTVACVDFCATCSAVDYSFAKEVMK